MRKLLLAGVCLVANCYGVLFAQNKTLGVGVPAPNPNAALHVESPTANQGFIMPRLTTVQRLAMNALLTGTDKGLMLYDTDLNTIFIWDGLIWKSSSEVAGGPALVYPYADTVSTSPGANSNLFKLLYTGAATESVGVSHFENQNPNNTSDALKVTTNGLGSAGRFTINNTKSKKPVLWVETNSDSTLSAPIYGLNTGKGDVAASFRITNPANAYPALYAESLGSGRVATFIKNGTGSQPAVFANVKTTGHGFWAEHEGTSGYAAILQSVNASNPSGAVFIEAVGTGFSLFTQKSMPTSTGDVIYSEHLGTSGSPGRFVINNTANPSSVLISSTNGSGPAISAENSGATDGFAGVFNVTNATNNFPAIQASTAGNGSGVRVMQNTGMGPGMDVFMQNTSSTAPGLAVGNDGLGQAGSFTINNAANNNSGVAVNTIGLGDAGFFQIDNGSSTNAAVKGRVINAGGTAGAFEVFNTANNYSAVYARTDGTGNAGNFTINNGTNASPALVSSTIGTGAAIEAQTATGFAAVYARRDGASNGNAGLFEITNAANTYPALQVNTAGTGFAINARHTGTTGDAVYAEHAGAGNGSAGNFRISNSGNTASALYAATNSTTGGAAIGASNDANGIAFAIWNGGVQVTTSDVTTTTIATRASAYRVISGGTSFNITFGPLPGEVFMVYNDTASQIDILDGGGTNITSIPAGQGKTFVVFAGGFIRAF